MLQRGNDPGPIPVCLGVSRRQQVSRKRARAEERRRVALRRKRIRIGLITGASVLAVAGLLVAFKPGPAPSGATDPTAWDLPALHGDTRVTLAGFNGKPTVAAFFASWCPHCRRELPGFAALSRQVGDQVNFVGINTQDSGNGSGLAETSGIDAWPLARDVGGADGRGLSTAFGARGMPLTVIYGPAGDVVDVNRGVVSAEQLATKLSTFFGITTS